ncbi:hypothetical protein GF327_09240 [Candidatus Woesearchaeota archaeon]|nr:hypothetical protein [Candidatus Woesearchaeota archaeon]
MGFITDLIDRFTGKQETNRIKYVVVAETPTKKINQMIGYAFLKDKIPDKEKLQKQLEEENVYVVYAYNKKPRSKNKRIKKIQNNYEKIKDYIDSRSKIVLLHNYLDEAIGDKIKEEFDSLEVHNFGYPRSYKKLRKKAMESLPLYYLGKDI